MIDKREDGKVLVNVNHTNDEEAIFLAPQIARSAKPHQVIYMYCVIMYMYCVIMYIVL